MVSSLTQSSFSQAAAAKGSQGEDSQMLKSIMGESAKKRDPTKQEPFNLTKPKPKVIPEPEAMKREVQANPIPKAIY